jgi:hypothetical protein
MDLMGEHELERRLDEGTERQDPGLAVSTPTAAIDPKTGYPADVLPMDLMGDQELERRLDEGTSRTDPGLAAEHPSWE